MDDPNITLYGLKSCDSCRRARDWFADNGIEVAFHDVRDDGITIQMLERWADRVKWQALLNKRSLTWRRIPELDRQNLSREAAVALMLDNPTLIKRPVIETPKQMIVGFDAEAYGRIFDGAGH
ncbi:MAG: Spx/MgsR family RNA polymerase-binding regulatory protein [Gammaproteobacteria bacterium]|jgi:arsenate reductase